jgi:hypothetical protein
VPCGDHDHGELMRGITLYLSDRTTRLQGVDVVLKDYERRSIFGNELSSLVNA